MTVHHTVHSYLFLWKDNVMRRAFDKCDQEKQVIVISEMHNHPFSFSFFFFGSSKKEA